MCGLASRRPRGFPDDRFDGDVRPGRGATPATDRPVRSRRRERSGRVAPQAGRPRDRGARVRGATDQRSTDRCCASAITADEVGFLPGRHGVPLAAEGRQRRGNRPSSSPVCSCRSSTARRRGPGHADRTSRPTPAGPPAPVLTHRRCDVLGVQLVWPRTEQAAPPLPAVRPELLAHRNQQLAGRPAVAPVQPGLPCRVDRSFMLGDIVPQQRHRPGNRERPPEPPPRLPRGRDP